MTEHLFAFAVLSPVSGVETDSKWQVTPLLELTQSQYEDCVEACAWVEDYKGDAQLFDIVLWNYEDYVDLFNECLKAYADKKIDQFLVRRPDFNLNRCLMNLLSSMRSYLDYTETKLKRLHGKEAPITLKFLELCHNAYDKSFAYRFLYYYRNFAQHCGLPLTRVIFNASEDGDFSLDVDIKRDDLLSKAFDWKKELREEIGSQRESISINNHIYEMMQCLQEIHTAYLDDEVGRIKPQVEVMKGLIDRIPDRPDELHLVRFPELTQQDVNKKFDFRFQMVPLDVVDYLGSAADTGL